MKNSKKLVIAYSGGLDTSYCAVSLSKAGYDVHAVSVNTGGFTDSDIQTIEQNAYKMGVSTYKNIQAVSTFYQKVVKYLIFGNVLKNNTYPLSVSAERIVQAIEIIEYAKSINVQYGNIKIKEIKKGDITHIKGPSGSGKTTFLDLLSGLLKPNSGDVLVDNKNINNNFNKIEANIQINNFGNENFDYINDKVFKNLLSTPLSNNSIIFGFCAA